MTAQRAGVRHRTSLVLPLSLLGCVLTGSTPVEAQISYPSDTTAAYAAAEGRKAADGVPRGTRTFVAISGGTLLGLFGMPALGGQDREPLMASAVGGLLLVGSVQGANVLPPEYEARIRYWPVTQQVAFRDAFLARAMDRRHSSAMLGIVVGGMIGISLLATGFR